jgi:hypothetical protein
MFECDQDRNRHHTDHDRRHRCVRKPGDERMDVMKERTLHDVKADQLGQLVEHDDNCDTALEAGQHRLRNEVRDEPEPEHGSGSKDNADQQRERSRRNCQLRYPPAAGGNLAKRGRCQDGQRCARTDAEGP